MLGIGACATSSGDDPDGSTGSGGSGSGSGGSSTGTGGKVGSGGATGSGGSASGGAPGSGGSASGGITGSGGKGSGGSASGGATGSGGSGSGGVASGGATGSGGTASGGATGSGGSGSGGVTGTAGAKGSGGAASGGTLGGGGRGGGTTASGGMVGSGGVTGSGGSTASAGACSFASGLNVAWVNFAKDVPNPTISTFTTLFKNTYAAGGRVVRWWFHTDGTTTPGYDSSGMAVKLPQNHIDGVKAILSAANANGVAVNISLWSFDMLQSGAGNTYMNNQKLIEVDANRQAYIDNYLTPLVTALKGTPGLYSYEIFNEPEGMAEKGWATHRTKQAFINKTVNWLAAAIHSADPNVLVTNGSQTFDYCSSVSGKTNNYSDASLRSAGSKQNGTLDFYEVHYYTSNGTSNSPFKNAAAHWGLDKKIVMGEFYALTQDGTNGPDTYTYLYTNGYNGAWAWQYESNDPSSSSNNNGATTKWPTMQVPMQNVYSAHMSEVGSCP
jgi:hypothetical protein